MQSNKTSHPMTENYSVPSLSFSRTAKVLLLGNGTELEHNGDAPMNMYSNDTREVCSFP